MRFALTYSTVMLLAMIRAAAGQDPAMEIDLWPGGKALDDDAATISPERTRLAGIRGGMHRIAGRPFTWLTAVTDPRIAIYPPPPEKNIGVGVVICPGGGYYNLAIDLEGEEIAQWLNDLGITGIILKYRVPRRPGQDVKLPNPYALNDAQRAVSLVRSRAQEWGIDPNRIGMIGFSAGGHMVAATATNFEHRGYAPIDAVDQVSCRPDFGIVCYPGYTKPGDNDDLSPTVRPIAAAPPLFIVQAGDDSEASVEHSVILYLHLKRAGAPVELHVYEQGEHGFGVRDVGLPIVEWTRRCEEWLRRHGFLDIHPPSVRQARS